MEKRKKTLSTEGLDILSEMEQLEVFGGGGDPAKGSNTLCGHGKCTNGSCTHGGCAHLDCNNGYCKDGVCQNGYGVG